MIIKKTCPDGWVVDKTKIMQCHILTEVGVDVLVEVTTCPDGWVVDKTKINAMSSSN